MPVDANSSISNLLRAQQTGFRQVVDEQNQLVRNTETTGLKAKLVSMVERGSMKSGSLAGRAIKIMVDGKKFENISHQLRANADRSVKNVLTAVAETETRGLDADLKKMVESRIDGRLGDKRSGFSAKEFSSLHEAITEKFIPERLASRQPIIDAIESGQPTSTMQALGQSDLRIAIESLTTGRSPRQLLNETRTPFRKAVNLEGVMAVTSEITCLANTLKNSGEVMALQSQIRRLETGAAAAEPERLAQLQTELAELQGRADAQAEATKASYVAILEGLHEQISAGEDALTLSASRYEEDVPHGPGVEDLSKMVIRHNSQNRDGLEPSREPQEQVGKRSVSFDKAYTREDTAAAGLDQTQLWELAETRGNLTLDQVETALAEVDMNSLRDPLLSRLENKVTKSLNNIVRRQGQDTDVQARVRTAREHPLCNPEVGFTNHRYHGLDDIGDMLSIMDVDAPLVSDKKLAFEMYDSLMRTAGNRYETQEDRATAAELKQHPVFKKHVLGYIEEKMSGTTLNDRGKEAAIAVLRDVSNDASASDAGRAQAAALLQRLAEMEPYSISTSSE